jgi:hypothetical protein
MNQYGGSPILDAEGNAFTPGNVGDVDYGKMPVTEDDGNGNQQPLTAREHLQALYDRVNLITARAVDKDEMAQLVNDAIRGIQGGDNDPWLTKEVHNGVQDGNRQAIQGIRDSHGAVHTVATQALNTATAAQADAATAQTQAGAAQTQADAAHTRADAAHTLATGSVQNHSKAITTLQDTVHTQGGLLKTHQAKHDTHRVAAARYLNEMSTMKSQQGALHSNHKDVLAGHIQQLGDLQGSVRNITATQAEQAQQLQGQQLSTEQIQEMITRATTALTTQIQTTIDGNNDTLRNNIIREILATPITLTGGGKKQRKSSYRRRRSRKR